MIREGQVYEAMEDVDLICMTAWSAPFTGGHDRVLPKGERVTVAHDPSEGATTVYCDPLRYDELHEQMVPARDRKSRNYSNYYFCIDLTALENQFTLVSTNGEQAGGHQPPTRPESA